VINLADGPVVHSQTLRTTGPAAYLVIRNVSPSIWKAPIFACSQVVGRLPECEIRIPPEYSSVSRRHVLIGARPRGIWIQDIGSSGGTRLNGVPLARDHESTTVIGDRISLADLEMYLVSPTSKLAGADGDCAMDDCSDTGLRLLGPETLVSYRDRLIEALSPAELEVVAWICRGETTNQGIGAHLFRSPHTVRTQLNSIYKKLNVHSRDELIAFMRQCEIV
jgi:DNA-binding CsgD family transcriptional regulator